MNEWCECEEVGVVYRDGRSTCAKCGGRDAYKSNPNRPKKSYGKEKPFTERTGITIHFGEGFLSTSVPAGEYLSDTLETLAKILREPSKPFDEGDLGPTICLSAKDGETEEETKSRIKEEMATRKQWCDSQPDEDYK